MSILYHTDVYEDSETGLGLATSPDASWYLPCKTAADKAAALVLLVLAAPVVLVLMAIIRATSKGPAIYRQRRLGRGDGRSRSSSSGR